MLPDLVNTINTFGDTSEVPIPSSLIDQIIGQDHAVEVVRLAASQRRFILIAGEPGTGKSLLGQAASEIMKSHDLVDVIAYENKENRNMPLIRLAKAGQSQTIVENEMIRQKRSLMSELFLIYSAFIAVPLCGLFYYLRDREIFWILGSVFLMVILWRVRQWILRRIDNKVPKVLVSNSNIAHVPFVDATGSRDGALFGDVRHDPYQSGGMETPPHMLLEAGAIHRAHGGVLYIDEAAVLSPESQQNLLTAIQTKIMPIMGRSPGSSGTLIRSHPLPCDFMLIMAGNFEDIEKIHPALRSRIKGYGYEISTKICMPVTEKNTLKLIQFIAQEVCRDGKIPHFSSEGIKEILMEAVLRSDVPDNYTLRLRELGGLVRISGDIALKEGYAMIEKDHVRTAVKYAKSIEEQRNEDKFNDA